MIGFEICRLLSLQSAVYQNLIGLFHINEIPEKIDYHKFAIINDSNHWFVIHRNLLNEIEVFDSLGKNSSASGKVKNHFNSNFATNRTQLQSDNSALCGEFSIYYILQRFYNDDVSFNDFLNQFFSSNKKRNEERVKKCISGLENGRF